MTTKHTVVLVNDADGTSERLGTAERRGGGLDLRLDGLRPDDALAVDVPGGFAVLVTPSRALPASPPRLEEPADPALPPAAEALHGRLRVALREGRRDEFDECWRAVAALAATDAGAARLLVLAALRDGLVHIDGELREAPEAAIREVARRCTLGELAR